MHFIEEVIVFSAQFQADKPKIKSGSCNSVMYVIISLNDKTIKIWEDQWKHHTTIVKSRITSLFGKTKRIYGRKTITTQLTKPQLLQFLEKNHLNEPVNAKHKYGLICNEELVAVASFSKKCPIHRNGKVFHSHELVRYCSKLNTTVVGGLSKLIQHFKSLTDADDIVTLVDKEWSNGAVYKKLGFKLLEETPPQIVEIDLVAMKRVAPIQLKNTINNLGNLKFLLPLK